MVLVRGPAGNALDLGGFRFVEGRIADQAVDLLVRESGQISGFWARR